MSGIEGAKGMSSWIEQSVSGPDGPVTRAKESVRSKLADGGFVDVSGGSLSTLRARIGIQQSLSEEAVTDFSAASRLVTSLRKKAMEGTDQTKHAFDDVEPDRATALLW